MKEKSLSQRTECNSYFLLKIVKAATQLDKAIHGRNVDLTLAKEITGLLEETYEDYARRETISEGDFSSVWESALTQRLIPEIYGITRKMPYKKEHFEAGIYFIVEQLRDLEKADKVRLEFAKGIMCKLGTDILREKEASFRQPTEIGNPYKRGLAA